MALKKRAAVYVAVVAACAAAGIVLGWGAVRVNNFAYDYMMYLAPPPQGASESVVVAIDEATFSSSGGARKMRSILAGALEKIAAANPQAVAIDVTLHDEGD